MNLQSTAKALNGKISCGKILAPGPGHSRVDRSMSVILDQNAPDGFLVHSFCDDDFRDCRDHVKSLLGIQSDWQPVQPRSRPVVRTPISLPKTNHTASAQKIWNSAKLIYGTPAEAYLTGRGLVLPDNIHHALRFHPACPLKGETVPVMLAQMVDFHTNEFRGVHRTRLDKKDKAMLGPAKGACVKLTVDADVTFGLHLTEGVETGLALMTMGFQPLWACLSAGGLAKLPVPKVIECVTIFADNDASQTGQNAAIECGARWRAAGREVNIFTTPDAGTDFADRSAA